MNKGEKEEKKNNNGVIIGVIIFVIIIIGLIIFFLTQGSSTTTGNYPDNVSDKSLTCTATNIDYPFFAYDKSNKKEAEINVLFSKDKLRSISLAYSLYYDNAQDIVGSEAHNHAAMNISFGEYHLGADAFNANYAKLEDRMRMSLYASGSDITTTALRYFLINTESVPEKITIFQNIYQNKGFKCETSE